MRRLKKTEKEQIDLGRLMLHVSERSDSDGKQARADGGWDGRGETPTRGPV